jgi:putative cell wall-binding protein
VFDRSCKRATSLVLAALLVVTMVPGAAFAAGDPNHAALADSDIRALTNIAKDAYEPDDTPAQAKPLVPASYHTWHPLAGGRNDIDWMTFTVDTVGTPYLFETVTPATANNFSDPMIRIYDEAGSLEATTTPWTYDGQLATSDDHLQSSLDAGIVFVAPHPGKFYVRVESDDTGSGQWGEYWLYGYKGIGRRIAGDSRFDTTVNVSRLLWGATSNIEAGWRRGSSSGIVIANGKAPTDAFAAGILAGMTGSPLLLTDGPTKFTPATRAEFDRLALTGYYGSSMTKSMISPGGGVPFGKTPIYAVGGPGSLGNAFVRSLGANQYIGDVTRIQGADRYQVMANVMQKIMDIHASISLRTTLASRSPVRSAFIVNGEAYSDVAAAAPVAAACCGSLLLTKKNSVPKATTDAITRFGVTKIVVVGGKGSISAAVYARLRSMVASDADIVRLEGPTRYDVNLELVKYEIANADYVNTERMVVISGESVGDAFAAVPLSVQMDYAPVLFTKPSRMSQGVKWFIETYKPLTQVSYMIGGKGSINQSVYNLWNRFSQPFPPAVYDAGPL